MSVYAEVDSLLDEDSDIPLDAPPRAMEAMTGLGRRQRYWTRKKNMQRQSKNELNSQPLQQKNCLYIIHTVLESETMQHFLTNFCGHITATQDIGKLLFLKY